MPLTNLLSCILLAFAFAGVCFGYGASLEIDGGHSQRNVMLAVGVCVITLLLIALGIWKRQKWAKSFLTIILYLGIIGWIGVLFFWIKSLHLRLGFIERAIPIVFTVFVLGILLGGIFYLRNKKFLEEFED